MSIPSAPGSVVVHFWRSLCRPGMWACCAASKCPPYKDGRGSVRVLQPIGHIGYGHTVQAARKAWHNTPD